MTKSRINLGTPPGTVLAWLPTIAASGSSVFVAWEDLRLGPVHIFFNRSGDGGGTWLPAPVLLDPTTNLSVHPRLSASGPLVIMVAEGSWGLQPDVICNRSNDSGATWLPTDVRLNRGTSGSGLRVYHPQVAISGSEIYVTWEDLRSGGTDIFFNRPLASFQYGAGLPGSGSQVPTLSTGGAPTIGALLVLNAANGLGGASGWLLLGLSGRASLPLLGGNLLIYLPTCLFPVAALPGGRSWTTRRGLHVTRGPDPPFPGAHRRADQPAGHVLRPGSLPRRLHVERAGDLAWIGRDRGASASGVARALVGLRLSLDNSVFSSR